MPEGADVEFGDGRGNGHFCSRFFGGVGVVYGGIIPATCDQVYNRLQAVADAAFGQFLNPNGRRNQKPEGATDVVYVRRRYDRMRETALG